MNGNYGKFRRLLEELFQLDHADLDFGIYRIMNQKRDEIMHFLDNDLLPQVQEAFREYEGVDRAGVEAELKEAIQQAESLGVDPESTRKVKELREKLSQAVDVTKLENEVFSDLYDFFRRYYHEGDFLSLRRYKEGVYAIPYEGEEVKLHWANHDQYYVKTSEYFRDYTFKLPSGKRVHFKLVEADTEKDNQKAEAGKERRFILCEEDPLIEVDGELHIRFEYRPDPDKSKQDSLNNAAFETILNRPGFSGWKAELAQPMPTESNPNRTLLEKHLSDYTARNTFDYFIHKDLGGFLRRELDFYIKNEIMHLDDIENESAPRVEQYLSKIKAIRKIAHKIIQFLAQIEDFQKKLWLKKKFVVETNYCITLDRVPEELWDEILQNESQIAEWRQLYALDELLELDGLLNNGLNRAFLRRYPTMPVDTQHFAESFRLRLLECFGDLHDWIEGVLISGENFQALNLLIPRYSEHVKCIYIDPPYNTGNDEFIYKDSYQHSSWLSMMADRLFLGREILRQDGAIFISIDSNELENLRKVMNDVFGEGNYISCIASVNNPKGRSDDKYIATAHESLMIYGKGGISFYGWEAGENVLRRYNKTDHDGRKYREIDLRKTGDSDRREDRPNLFYYFLFNSETGHFYPTRDDAVPEGYTQIVPLRADNAFGNWRWELETANNRIERLIPKLMPIRGVWTVFEMDYLDPNERVKPTSAWTMKDVNSERGSEQFINLGFRKEAFPRPKPLGLMERIVEMSVDPKVKDTVFDFFAGSGTTANAIINMNKRDGGKRRYVLVEMGDCFNIVLLPRIKKAMFCDSWEDGKPMYQQSSGHVIKYIRLESYEDSLNNLRMKRTEEQESLLAESDSFRESYMLFVYARRGE